MPIRNSIMWSERERLVRKLAALGVNVTIEEKAEIPDAA